MLSSGEQAVRSLAALAYLRHAQVELRLLEA